MMGFTNENHQNIEISFGEEVDYWYFYILWILVLIHDHIFLCAYIWQYLLLKITCRKSLKLRMKVFSFRGSLCLQLLRCMKISLAQEYFKRISQMKFLGLGVHANPNYKSLLRLVSCLRNLYAGHLSHHSLFHFLLATKTISPAV